MNGLSIQDVSKIIGIKPHTIRIWEKRYNFLKPDRSETNFRYYSHEKLTQLLNIVLLNKNGFKISHLNDMSAAQITHYITTLKSKEARQEREVNQLLESVLEVDLPFLENLLDANLKLYGISETFEEVIFPYLKKLELLFSSGIINDVQNNLIENIIRQKLYAAINETERQRKSKKSVLLFQTKWQKSDIYTLYLNYLLKSRGFKVYNVGHVAIAGLKSFMEEKQITTAITHITTIKQQLPESFINEIDLTLQKSTVVVYAPDSCETITSPNLQIKTSLFDVKLHFFV